MRLTWHGHACFRVVADDGLAIVTDPYDPVTSGYRPLEDPADVVARSSPDDGFHCNAHLVPGDPLVVEALDLARRGTERVVGGVRFRAVPAEEGKRDVERPGVNAIYRFDVDGIAVAHLGDAGQPLSDAQLDFLAGTEVLLALAGGPPTIPLDALRSAVDVLAPALVVPMHFRTLRLKLTGIAWIHEFLAHMEGVPVDFAFDDTVRIDHIDLPDQTRVLVLDHV